MSVAFIAQKEKVHFIHSNDVPWLSLCFQERELAAENEALRQKVHYIFSMSIESH